MKDFDRFIFLCIMHIMSYAKLCSHLYIPQELLLKIKIKNDLFHLILRKLSCCSILSHKFWDILYIQAMKREKAKILNVKKSASNTKTSRQRFGGLKRQSGTIFASRVSLPTLIFARKQQFSRPVAAHRYADSSIIITVLRYRPPVGRLESNSRSPGSAT